MLELPDGFYGALGFIFFEPQFGHSVAPFFMKVFLQDVHQYIPNALPFSASSSGFISNGVYVLHINSVLLNNVLYSDYSVNFNHIYTYAKQVNKYPFILLLRLC